MSEGESELLRLAQSVADGRSVDWLAATPSDEAWNARIRGLQILASIAGACGMPLEAPRPSGDVLFRWGHLEIRERIGEGAFGDVYLGWDPTLERDVAVKFIRPRTTPSAAHVLQEGRHLARIRHPGVVMVFGAEELDGRVGIWMEHVRGRTLEDVLQQEGPLAPDEAMGIGIDLCRALAAVHRAGLVHRDVKTRNVMREDSGRIVLMDFGTGVETGAAQLGWSTLAGTPIYLAPEVLRGESASPQSDLYGLGVLLYRLTTGRYPIDGSNLEALREAHERGTLIPLRAARPSIPAPFAAVVECSLATDPARRFASAEQMELALATALHAPRKAARRRALLLAAVVAVLAVSSAIAAYRMLGRPATTTERPTVAVADVANGTHEEELDALAGMLTTSLEQSKGLSVLTRSRMTDMLGPARANRSRIDRALALEIGRRANAVALLIPSVQAVGGRYTIGLEAVEPRRGKRLFRASVTVVDKRQVPSAIDALSQRVRSEIEPDRQAARRPIRPVAQITTASLGAFHQYDLAERLIDRLEMSQARARLERAVALDSTFGLAHGRLAYVDWWLDDEDAQRAELAKASAWIDRIPEKSRYHLRAQVAMSERQGLEAGRSVLLEMERFYPQDKEMLYDIGDYSSHLNDFPMAIQYLEKVVAMEPGFERALQHLALVYRDMGSVDRYLAWAKKCAAADSSSASDILLGNAMVAAGDPEGGIEVLARARQYGPRPANDVAFWIMNVRFHQGRSAEGLREWDRLMAGAATPTERSAYYRLRATGRIHEGAYRAAAADLDRALALARQAHDPVEEAMGLVAAAAVHMIGMNDPSSARPYLKRCAELSPPITYLGTYFNYWPYWGALFKLQLLTGDLPAARALAKEKFAVDKWYAPYVDAYLHAANGQCTQSAAAASRVVDWGPAAENIPLLYSLGRCQFEQGQLTEAAESLLRLQALYSHMTLGTPYYAKSFLLLGEVYEKCGDPRRAVASYSRLLDLWRDADRDLPDYLEVRRRLATLGPVSQASTNPARSPSRRAPPPRPAPPPKHAGA